MQRDETRRDEVKENISSAQAAVVEAMLGGKTITDAATAVGVDRSTVHRWLKDDFAFQAELNRGRRETRQAAFRNLERLAAKAAECLAKALDQGDVKAALEILKRADFLKLTSIGSEDAAALAAEAQMQASERKAALKQRALMAENW
jgi:hypothetical protein